MRELPGDRKQLESTLEARGLRCAGRYVREVGADLERIWENVFDWEHLPWLHGESFASIELLERGAWGWRARLGTRRRKGPARASVVELRADRARGRYVTATLEGVGSGSEFWTQLTRLTRERSRVELAFWVPELEPARLKGIGAALLALYERLWDEDESMMLRRTQEIAARRGGGAARETWSLGPLAELRPRLPLRVETAAGPFRIVESDGVLLAHSTRCPHLLGPLEDVPVVDGCIRCPWHGYAFDLRSGAALGGGPLRLETAAVEVDPRTSEVRLSVDAAAPADRPGTGSARAPLRRASDLSGR